MSNFPALEIRILSSEWTESLSIFFQTLKKSGYEVFFHPHPLTAEEARRICHYTARDLYYVLIDGEDILGYAMLRGWDEGYTTPSLGIAIDPSSKGLGLGRLFMLFLHAAARRRGSKKIRVKVYADNFSAVKLYRSFGYEFQDQEKGQIVGFLNLE